MKLLCTLPSIYSRRFIKSSHSFPVQGYIPFLTKSYFKSFSSEPPRPVSNDLFLDDAIRPRSSFDFSKKKSVLNTLNLSLSNSLLLIRWDKPVGTLLLLFPCFWGIGLATTHAISKVPLDLLSPLLIFPFHLVAYFSIGALLMRSAGCIVNDIWDKDLDKFVERTKSRPLASGVMTTKQAISLMLGLVSASGIIAFQLAPVALAASISTLPLVALYPLAKRVTYFPQFILGLCFNWGIFIGYASVLNFLGVSVTLPAYIGAIIWTIFYDTIYAHQDKKDDILSGIKSTALFFGNTKRPLFAMIPLIISSLMISGYNASQSAPFFIGIVVSGLYLTKILISVNLNDPFSCMKAFKENVKVGFLVFLSILIGNTWLYISRLRAQNNKSLDSLTESPIFADKPPWNQCSFFTENLVYLAKSLGIDR